MIAGLVLHLGLSLLFGMVFAIGVTLLRLTQRPLMLLGAGLVYGLALYLVNFQIIARAAFPFFVNPKGPDQVFELWIHPVAYGLVLVLFFCWLLRRQLDAALTPPAHARRAGRPALAYPASSVWAVRSVIVRSLG